MAVTENPPFDRGQYDATGSQDNNLGKEYEFNDVDWSSNPAGRTSRSGKMVRVRLVKNGTGAALLPRRLAAFSTTANEPNAVARGYTALDAQRGFPVDEALPATGVPDGAAFYVVVKGPAL